MQSHITPEFRNLYRALPTEIRAEAQFAYRLWQTDTSAHSLYFKEINAARSIWSVRVTQDYRALGRRVGSDVMVWYWIGKHSDYDQETTARRIRKRRLPENQKAN